MPPRRMWEQSHAKMIVRTFLNVTTHGLAGAEVPCTSGNITIFMKHLAKLDHMIMNLTSTTSNACGILLCVLPSKTSNLVDLLSVHLYPYTSHSTLSWKPPLGRLVVEGIGRYDDYECECCTSKPHPKCHVYVLEGEADYERHKL